MHVSELNRLVKNCSPQNPNSINPITELMASTVTFIGEAHEWLSLKATVKSLNTTNPTLSKVGQLATFHWCQYLAKSENTVDWLKGLSQLRTLPRSDKVDSLKKEIQNKIDSLGKSRSYETINRARLADIRSRAMKGIKAGFSSKQISRQLSDDISDFVGAIYKQGFDKLGPPPCQCCLVVLGSLARQEPGPYPDFDSLMILETKTKETLDYFTALNQYVADEFYRLGEHDKLGKPGLRFCEGNLNPQYLRYDFRKSSRPDDEFILSISDSIKDKEEELALARAENSHDVSRISSELDQLKKTCKFESKKNQYYKVMRQLERNPESSALKLDRDRILDEILAESSSEKAQQLKAKKERLKELESNISKAGGNKELLNELILEKTNLEHEIEADLNYGPRAGSVYSTVDFSKNEATLLSAQALEQMVNQRVKDDLESLQHVMGDSRPILGNVMLYERYISLKEASVAKNPQVQAVKNIKKQIDCWKEEEVTPAPVLTNKLPEVVNVKYELYRFPQVIVAKLSEYMGITNKNTFDRIQALKERGVFDAAFADRLTKAVDHLVKIRILTQTAHKEEFEFLAISNWANYKAFKDRLIAELEDIKKNIEIIKKECDQIRDQIAEIKAKISQGDKTLEPELKKLERALKERDIKINKSIIYADLIKKDFPKVEKVEFKNGLILSKADMELLIKETLPTLHELFLRSEASVATPHFNLGAYSK